MAFLVDPLIEKEIEVAAGRVLECTLQVLRNYVVTTMARAVEIQRFEKQLVADRAPQHMQHEAALLVEMSIEQLDRRAILVGDDGTPVRARILIDNRHSILAKVPRKLV